jgi:hypothetical protein
LSPHNGVGVLISNTTARIAADPLSIVTDSRLVLSNPFFGPFQAEEFGTCLGFKHVM